MTQRKFLVSPALATCGSSWGRVGRSPRLGLALGLLALWGTVAQAGTIADVATRAGLGATETVAWGTAADDFTAVASPYTRSSSPGGVSATATLAGGFTILQQNGVAFTANFSDGEILLDTFFVDGPISISFDTAVRGVGFNIAHETFASFVGTMSFYGAGDVLFGTTSVSGASNANNDGSAPFLGGISSFKDIVRVQVSVDPQGGSSAFAINQMALNVTAVPEPASALMLALGLAGGLLLRGTRRAAA